MICREESAGTASFPPAASRAPVFERLRSGAKAVLKDCIPEGKWERLLTGFLFGGLILLFAGALTGGLSSVGTVRYWNNDDANILTYYGHLYERLILPPVPHISYPFVYYYVAALGVLPAYLLLGPVPKALALGWRLTNDLSFMLTNLLLLFVGKRYFNRTWIGLIAAALHALCPVVLQQPFLLKPTAFQSLLNILMIISLFELYRRPGPGRLRIAALFAGLGFSTKYHAPFFFPTVYGLLFALAKLPEPASGRRRHEMRRTVLWGGGFLLIAGILWGAVQHFSAPSAAWLEKYKDLPAVKSGLAEHAIIRFDAMISAAFFSLCAVFLAALWGFSRARRSGAASPFTRLLLRMNVANADFLSFLAVFLGVAAFTNPYLFVFPKESLNAFTVLFTIVETGGKMKDVLIGGPPSRWFGIAAHPTVFGTVGIGLLFFAILFEAAAGRRTEETRKSAPYRAILLAQAVTYFVYLYAQIGYRKHHYLEPLVPAAALLSGFSLVTAVGWIRRGWIRRLAGTVGALIIGLGLMERAPALNEVRRWVTGRDKDPGVRAAEWINKAYPDKPTLVSDLLSITYMIKGEVEAGGFHYQPWELREVLGRITPPDLIILNKIASLKLIPELRNRYRLVRSDFASSSQGDMEMVLVYERI